MILDYCEICDAFIYGHTKHKCDPLYEVIIEEDDYDEEWDDAWIYTCRGVSYRDAAKNFAKDYNEKDGDYSLMNSEMIILIRLKGELDSKRFVIYAEPDILYSSKELEKDRKTSK